MRRMLVGLVSGAVLLIPGSALADPIELGACNEPGSIVVRVGQTAKVCVNPGKIQHVIETG